MKIRHHYTQNEDFISIPVGKSQTIPNQAISVRTAVSMFTRGEKLPPMSVYDTYDEVDSDETHPLNRLGLDLDDVTIMREHQRYKMREAQAKHRAKEEESKLQESEKTENVSRSEENDAE